MNISKKFKDKLDLQDYGKQPVIEGVKIIELKMFVDDGGNFMEVCRLNDKGGLIDLPDFKVLQANYSVVLPSAIKAFHFHKKQEDVWFVPPSERIVVGLFDIRDSSPTEHVLMRLTLGGGKAQLLYIPRGVAHGNANPYKNPMHTIYFVNQHFNPEDEFRLPWDVLGKEFWEIEKG